VKKTIRRQAVRHRLPVLPQYILPKRLITERAGAIASAAAGSLTTAMIRTFVNRYGVDMSEAADPDITHYPTFNEFFTRALKPGARPLATADLVCPVDGAISQFGAMEGDQIFQAKGHHFLTTELVGGNEDLATQFDHGSFATLYLSPKDYHRIHMPCDGRLARMIHVPGDLFSVNPTTARGVPGLFARNERVVCVFDGIGDATSAGSRGPFVLVLVGATIVGSVGTVWHGIVTPPRMREVRSWNYADRAIVLKQGDEMGRFQLGSTVVLLFPKSGLQFNPDWAPGRPIRLGEMMAMYPRS
jgi:phosphatidylserine decarboxylase